MIHTLSGPLKVRVAVHRMPLAPVPAWTPQRLLFLLFSKNKAFKGRLPHARDDVIFRPTHEQQRERKKSPNARKTDINFCLVFLFSPFFNHSRHKSQQYYTLSSRVKQLLLIIRARSKESSESDPEFFMGEPTLGNCMQTPQKPRPELRGGGG